MFEIIEEMFDKIGGNKMNNILKIGKEQFLRKYKMDKEELLCISEGV